MPVSSSEILLRHAVGLKTQAENRPSYSIPTVSAEEPGIAYTHTYGYHLASLTPQLTPAGRAAVVRFLRRP
jgi:hypothetical protein